MLHLTRATLLALGASALMAAGCPQATPAPQPPKPEPAPQTVSYETLDAPTRLLRASMALRGVRPSLADYEKVQADPDAYDALVDGYINSEAFGLTIRQNFTEWLELDQIRDGYPAGFPSIGALEGMESYALNTSIIEAAGRLAEHIVVNDRPWTDVVTTKDTMADGVVATVWGLPYDENRGGWQVTEYTDGRPAAGVLSDGWVFTRMPSTANNRHRERASLIANTFLCHDYPGRPIKIPRNIDLVSEEARTNALVNNPVCASCHNTLDPLSSFFTEHYGLRLPETETAYPLVEYTPDANEGFKPPAFYGQPGRHIGDLGTFIASDPRFVSCQVKRFYSALTHVPVEDVALETIEPFRKRFIDSGFRVKDLVAGIVKSPLFAATSASLTAEGEAKNWPLPHVGPRRATPHQLDSLVQDLTGFQWVTYVPFQPAGYTVGTVPLMKDHLWGYRTLAGGPDNFDTTQHLRTANASTLLVMRGLAERAAREGVAADFANPAGARLITNADARAGDVDAAAEQLVELHLRLFGDVLETDDSAITAALAVFEAVYAEFGAERAWQVTVAALLQHPRVLFY